MFGNPRELNLAPEMACAPPLELVVHLYIVLIMPFLDAVFIHSTKSSDDLSLTQFELLSATLLNRVIELFSIFLCFFITRSLFFGCFPVT